ncbi:MAG: ribosome silencing factor [Elusimicrobia bacterium]|nr:ribosome silencing factor [Elusimicrobiota bacterium]
MTNHSLRRRLNETKELCRLLEDHLAINTKLLRIPHLASICDYVIIATATSKPHLDALENHLSRRLKDIGCHPAKPVEGRGSERWRIVDAGFAVIHLMDERARQKYNLENVWSEGKSIALRKKRAKAVINK